MPWREDQYLVLSKKRGWVFVHFSAQVFYGIRAECVSNHYLDFAYVLTKAQMDVLVAKAARLAVRTLDDGRS